MSKKPRALTAESIRKNLPEHLVWSIMRMAAAAAKPIKQLDAHPASSQRKRRSRRPLK